MADVFSTYDAIGNREDLANDIYDISPMDTPFVSGIAKNSATATNHEWQTDSLSAASNNAAIEGADATTTVSTPTVRLGNYTQISTKTPMVSRTQRQVQSAGRGDEMQYQIVKMSMELKRDQELILLANKAKVAGSEVLARESAGIESWLATNWTGSGSAPTGDGTDTRTAGALTAFDEADLKTTLASIWDEGGNPDMIMAGSFNKQAMSAFVGGGNSGPAQRVVDGDSTRVNTAIDVYVSDFGSLSVVPNRFMVQNSVLILEMDKWCLSSLATFQETTLAKNGDSDRVQLLSEYTLEAKNEAASGIVADNTIT
jgi:hypothetical protein